MLCGDLSNALQPIAREVLTRQLRRASETHIIDNSGSNSGGVALYLLSDPRDIRIVRYVGQTSQPRRRFIQHIGSARLWLPDQIPWWIKSPKLRPLYEWIRDLYRDDHRLPLMVVSGWVDTVREARLKEREQICEQMAQGMPLLNAELKILGNQLAFSYANEPKSPVSAGGRWTDLA